MGPWSIVVTGSECTGKTTLAQQLGMWLNVQTVPEYSRHYAVRKGTPLTAADVHPIAQGQIEAENFARAAAPNDGLVLDTDLVSTVAYASHYYGQCPSWITDAARERLADLYLLADIDIPWLPDGVRDRPQQRVAMHRVFVDTLTSFGALVLPVHELGDSRLQRAMAAVRGFAASRPELIRLRDRRLRAH